MGRAEGMECGERLAKGEAMILLASLIIFIVIARWQVIHLHDARDYHNPWFKDYKNGDLIYWRGLPATVIDKKTVDMVIKRHLVGLLPLWPRR